MRTVFIDTSAFYALFNSKDPNHQEASSCYRNEQLLLVTTHSVFTELLSLLTKRHGKEAAIRCGKELRAARDRLRILHLDVPQEERAWELFCKFRDKEYDLVDCLSFVCMEDQGIEEAFAYDRHFLQYGFQWVTTGNTQKF